MVYDSKIKDKVRLLRLEGLSLNQIQKETSVPKSTIRTWIPDIKLPKAKEKKLKERAIGALQKGRLKAAQKQREKRLSKEKKLNMQGKKDVEILTKRELFIAGIALYWAEGFKNKHEHRLGFCNSDPEMIAFYLKWLKESLKIKKGHITLRLTINQTYKEKELEIKKYWAEKTNIPLSQFTKTFYQNTVWKKQYNNYDYYGVLRIHVRESLNHLLKMRGWIEGLKLNI